MADFIHTRCVLPLSDSRALSRIKRALSGSLISNCNQNTMALDCAENTHYWNDLMIRWIAIMNWGTVHSEHSGWLVIVTNTPETIFDQPLFQASFKSTALTSATAPEIEFTNPAARHVHL